MKQVIVVTKLKHKDLRKATRHIHNQTLQAVKEFLNGLRIRYRVVDRSRLQCPLKTDLIVTVGGDGTALAASHFAGSSPLFCINSAPSTSTGFFCRASSRNFRPRLQKILEGKISPQKLPRLAVYLQGRKLGPYGLNEVLFASKLQGETARYTLRVGRHGEYHKSSGVWVATGAGSTAAIHSAGGKQDSPRSGRLQYKVREPCRFPKSRYRLLSGFVQARGAIKIISGMDQGMVFIDGGKWRYPVPHQAVLTVRGNVAPLKIFL
ncbi:MAG: NAD(+)/NADH kinase [Deltaproteobacteria bacterium]|nr:NAD(+)/NADH kinase [Deltaproteobacteria bacterium]